MTMFGDLSKLQRNIPRVAAVLGLAISGGAQAATYYADDNGPTNGDGTQARPFNTLAKLSNTLRPGDTGLIAPGNYNQGLLIDRSGEPGAPITFKALDINDKPKIRFTDKMVVQVAPYVGWIVIQGLDVQASETKSAIYLSNRAHHITVQGNYLHDSGCAGIGGGQNDYIQVLNNRVARNAKGSPNNCSGISLYQLTNYDTQPGYHNVIARNVVYGNLATIPNPNFGKTTDGNGIIIDDGRHTQRDYTAPAYTGATLIENNLTFDNGGRGIHVFQSDNVMIRNNTAYHNGFDPQNAETRPADIGILRSGNVEIYNNVTHSIAESNHYGITAQYSHDVVADHNVTFGANAYMFRETTLPYWGPNNIVANPKFLKPGSLPAESDFSVAADSPARKVGNGQYAPPKDIRNAKRAIPLPVTAGAYE